MNQTPDEVHYGTVRYRGDSTPEAPVAVTTFESNIALSSGDQAVIPAFLKVPPWPDDGERIEVHVYRANDSVED